MVALALHVGGKGRKVAIVQTQSRGSAPLQVGRRRERHELVSPGDRLHQLGRRRDVAHLPPGEAEALAGRTDPDGAVAHAGQGHQRDVAAIIENDVFIDFVAHGVDIVLEAKLGDEIQFLPVEDLGTGIHRRVEQDELGFRAKCRRQLFPGETPGRRLEPHQFRHAPCPPHDGQIGIVERLDQHDLVARLDQAEQAVAQRFCRSGGDEHLALPVDIQPLEAPGVVGDGLAELRNPHHRRILVVTVQQIVRSRRPHLFRPLVVGKALPEIHRLVLAGERRHDFEDCRAQAGHRGVCGFHANVSRCLIFALYFDCILIIPPSKQTD